MPTEYEIMHNFDYKVLYCSLFNSETPPLHEMFFFGGWSDVYSRLHNGLLYSSFTLFYCFFIPSLFHFLFSLFLLFPVSVSLPFTLSFFLYFPFPTLSVSFLVSLFSSLRFTFVAFCSLILSLFFPLHFLCLSLFPYLPFPV